MQAQASAQNASRVAIHDYCEVMPDAGDLEVGDIAHPDLVGSIDLKLADAVGHTGKKGMCTGIGVVEARSASSNARLSHQTGHTLRPTLMPACRSTPQMRGLPYVPSLAAYTAWMRINSLRSCSLCTPAPPQPGVEASAAHAIACAQRAQQLPRSRGVDEGKDLRFACEQNRTAFFSSSCSSRSKA